MSFSCSISHVGPVATVAPRGDIDLTTTTELRQALQAAAKDPTITATVVDLAGVTFIDSTALGVLVAAHTAAGRQNTKFTVINPGPMARMVLEVTGLFKVLVDDDAGEEPDSTARAATA